MTFEPGVSVSTISLVANDADIDQDILPILPLNAKDTVILEQLPVLQGIFVLEGSYRRGKKSNGLLPQSVLPHSFPSLESVTLQSSMKELNRYLSVVNGVAPRLRHLVVDVISTNDTKTFRKCVAQVADAFPLLESLTISRLEDYDIFRERDNGTSSVEALLTYEDLVPLTSLAHLQEVILHYCVPVSMTDNQLHTLLSQCPSLTVLELNQEPMILSPTELTVNVLPLLAQSCPQTGVPRLVRGHGRRYRRDTGTLHVYESVRNQFRGVPPSVTNDRGVLPLLAQVLPEDCKNCTVSPYPEDVQKLLDRDGKQGRQSRRNAWAKVANLMPILLDVRRQSASRALRERERQQPRTVFPENHNTQRYTVKKEE